MNEKRQIQFIDFRKYFFPKTKDTKQMCAGVYCIFQQCNVIRRVINKINKNRFAQKEITRIFSINAVCSLSLN